MTPKLISVSTDQAKMKDPWASPQLWKSGQFIASKSIASGIIRTKPTAMEDRHTKVVVALLINSYSLYATLSLPEPRTAHVSEAYQKSL